MDLRCFDEDKMKQSIDTFVVVLMLLAVGVLVGFGVGIVVDL